jgi:hypothetical membrane protein
MAFSPYNLTLAVVWTIFRIGEGLIQIYNKKDYWKLLNLAKQYSNAFGAEKNVLTDLGHNILKTKNSIFTCAQILFSIDTLAYSTLFVITDLFQKLLDCLGLLPAPSTA